jgi:membrane-associated protein
MLTVEPFKELIQAFIELDQHLLSITQLGYWLYLILFAIVFFETALMVMSLLPGDSLLFTAGTLAAVGSLDFVWLIALAIVATVLADSLNYVIGDRAGRRLLVGRLPFTKAKHLERTERYLSNRGRLTIVLARFVPYVRSLTPFVAGMSQMSYRRFLHYNLIGALVWVGFFVFGGYFFGNVPLVRENLSIVLVAVLILTTLPFFFEVGRDGRVLKKIRIRTRSSDTSLQ